TDAFRSAVGRVLKKPLGIARWAHALSPAHDLLSVDWIYFGIIPETQVSSLALFTRTPKKRAHKAIFCGLVVAHEIFLEEVWRLCCKETIWWERANGITTASKCTWMLANTDTAADGTESWPVYETVDKLKE